MTKWRKAVIRAAGLTCQVVDETAHPVGWLPLCIAYRKIETAEAQLAIARLKLGKLKAVQSGLSSGLRITVDG